MGARAQEEHDAFAQALRDRDVEVLYLTDLLTETLAVEEARNAAIETALADLDLGDTMRHYLDGLLGDADPEHLTTLLTAGIRNDEVPGRVRAGDVAAGPRRLPHRPTAQPALHPRLLGVGARPGRDHVARDAGAQARDPADRADLQPCTPASRARRASTATTTSTSRAATCCCWRPA